MKHWNKVLLFTVATVLAAVFISCKPVTGDTQGGGQNNPPAGPSVESVTISQTKVTLEVNRMLTLNASVLPTGVDASISWTSSDESVVSVTGTGEITAHKAGSADVTATAKADTSKTAVCKVTVVPEGEGIPATSITLSAQVLNLGVGETKLLSVTVSPDNAVMPELTWTSNDESIVRVYNGNIIGIREGSTTVTVSAFVGVTELTDSCQVTVTRTGIEGDWQTDWNRYFITAETITTYMPKDEVSDFIPQNRYSYTKSGNETKGTVTVTLKNIWNTDDNKYDTVDEYYETMIKQLKESMSSSLRDAVLPFVDSAPSDDPSVPSEEDIEIGLQRFIDMLESISVEMNMTFDESNLTEANLNKPVPQDVQDLYIAYGKMMQEEDKKPHTYEYEVTDDGVNPPMIQFIKVYDTTKKWFEQTGGQFSNGSGVNFDPQGKRLSIWDVNNPTEIRFSSVTETSLTEQDSDKTWTASWNENTLTLKSEDISYKLTWSGYYLF